jgi:hypothetical protein
MADAAAELDEGGAVRTLKDLFAGAAGGIAQVLLGEFGAYFFCSCSNCFSIDGSISNHVQARLGDCCTVATSSLYSSS